MPLLYDNRENAFINVSDLQALKAEIIRLQAELAKSTALVEKCESAMQVAVEEERNKCCRDICWWCTSEVTLVYEMGTYAHQTPEAGWQLCQARDIRVRGRETP